METTANAIEIFQVRKAKVLELANYAKQSEILNQEEADNLIRKIEQDTLTIGVIGQMKAGKSTFLNSFVFGKDVLPAATTPMTAALSVITYGEKESIDIEFYSNNEWAEMKMLAEQNLDDFVGDPIETSKIKAAKEMYAKSHGITQQLDSLLGNTKQDKLENLIEYVGADSE